MDPEQWKHAGEVLGYLITGALSLLGTQKLHSKLNSPSSEKEGSDSAMLHVIERIERKIDKLGNDVSGVKADVHSVKTDVELLADADKRHEATLHRLTNGFRDVDGRVAALESRIAKPM